MSFRRTIAYQLLIVCVALIAASCSDTDSGLATTSVPEKPSESGSTLVTPTGAAERKDGDNVSTIQGGSIVVLISSDPPTLNPYLAQAGFEGLITGMGFGGVQVRERRRHSRRGS